MKTFVVIVHILLVGACGAGESELRELAKGTPPLQDAAQGVPDATPPPDAEPVIPCGDEQGLRVHVHFAGSCAVRAGTVTALVGGVAATLVHATGLERCPSDGAIYEFDWPAGASDGATLAVTYEAIEGSVQSSGAADHVAAPGDCQDVTVEAGCSPAP